VFTHQFTAQSAEPSGVAFLIDALALPAAGESTQLCVDNVALYPL
jgi:hypothetical protein